jgi:hypothetical protein
MLFELVNDVLMVIDMNGKTYIECVGNGVYNQLNHLENIELNNMPSSFTSLIRENQAIDFETGGMDLVKVKTIWVNGVWLINDFDF